MIAIFAIALSAAAIGLLASWFAAKRVRRQLVPIFTLIAAIVGAYLTSGVRAELEQRELALTAAIALFALFVGSSGFLVLSKPRSAVMFSVTASLMFVATLPLTGFVLACGLIQSCP